jgi:hypothetical protein
MLISIIMKMKETVSKARIVGIVKRVFTYLWYSKNHYDMTQEEVIQALWLLVLDWRDDYGHAEFDKLCQKAGLLYNSASPGLVKTFIEMQKRADAIEEEDRNVSL